MKKKESSFQFSNSFQSSSYDGGKGRFTHFLKMRAHAASHFGVLRCYWFAFCFSEKIYIFCNIIQVELCISLQFSNKEV